MSGQALNVPCGARLLTRHGIGRHDVPLCRAIQHLIELGKRALRLFVGVHGEESLGPCPDLGPHSSIPQPPHLGLTESLLLARVIRHRCFSLFMNL